MILVGLNGTTIWPIINGRIDQYFRSGIFPYQWTWGKTKANRAAKHMPKEPYILTGFSAGATLCHQIGAIDFNCKGIMVHSGQYFEPTHKRLDLPILLLSTVGDIFPTDRDTKDMFTFYRNARYFNVSHIELPKTTWHGHEYDNGLDTMYSWCQSIFNYTLPIK